MKKLTALLLSMMLILLLAPVTGAEEVGLSAPWIGYAKEVQALFGEDPAVTVKVDEDSPSLSLYVEGSEKAEAIDALLPNEVTFGNVVMPVTVIPANEEPKDTVELIKTAFEGNPALSFIHTTSIMQALPVSYVVFKNKVVQYFNDDLGDVNGNRSTLYQEIAKEVLGDFEGIYFCTDASENAGVPLGEWP